jgi:hypothetical protein
MGHDAILAIREQLAMFAGAQSAKPGLITLAQSRHSLCPVQQ